jgi:hypothetical protein
MTPDPATFTTVVSDVFDNFGDSLLGAAPALLGIGIIAFGVPFVFRWAKRLVS